jgi:HK97 family phage prohead protease
MSDKAIYEAEIKAVGDGDSGEFTAIVSVFNNIDLTQDVVQPGAYADDIERWAKSEDNLPVIWSHQWHDPDYNIGVVKEMEELEAGDARLKGQAFDLGGLLVVGAMDLEDDSAGSKARKAWRLVKGRRVNNWSFHYETLKASMGVKDDQRVRFLEKLHITEVGPTHVGANRATQTVETKAAAEALGISVDDFAILRGMLEREKQATVTEPVVETHAVDPRLEQGRYLRFLD